MNNGVRTVVFVNPVNIGAEVLDKQFKKLMKTYWRSPHLFLLQVMKPLSTFAHTAYYAVKIHQQQQHVMRQALARVGETMNILPENQFFVVGDLESTLFEVADRIGAHLIITADGWQWFSPLLHAREKKTPIVNTDLHVFIS